MQFKFYIEYWDKQKKIRHAIFKGKDKYDAESKFYQKHPYTLIKKSSMI